MLTDQTCLKNNFFHESTCKVDKRGSYGAQNTSLPLKIRKKGFLRLHRAHFFLQRKIFKIQRKISKRIVLALIPHIIVRSISFFDQIATFAKTLLQTPISMRLMSVICHLSSLTSSDYVRCQMSAMTDDGHKLHHYGCLQKRLCKCSNLVEK